MSMRELLEAVSRLKRSCVKNLVGSRIAEFKHMRRRSSVDLFKELCFCILTANFSAERSLRIQAEVGDGFLTLSEPQLAETLKRLGHRYPNARARYIVEARRYAKTLKEILSRLGCGYTAREWLVRNVKGIGYKEASHFLRNVGCTDLAIIDFHIVDLLSRYGLMEKPKSLTRRRYVEIENLLRRIAKSLGITVAELDLYLWYMETGKVLK